MLSSIKERTNLIKINAINSYNIQTSYFFENWASVASTIFYTFTMLLFVKILYTNVNLFAGYSENEMVLLLFFGQLNFYADWLWSTNNILYLIESVRTGELDLILSKPIPSLFFVTFRDINLVNRIKDGVPNLLMLALVIDWSQVHTTLLNSLAALVIFVCGQVSWHCFRFLFALPVFFTGQSNQIFQLSGTFGETNDIPFEGFPDHLRIIFSTVIPSLIAAQMSASVFLGKSNALYMVLFSLVVSAILLMLKNIGWIIAIRNYSSASS
jgi:ABC-2 type transport system permease protein